MKSVGNPLQKLFAGNRLGSSDGAGNPKNFFVFVRLDVGDIEALIGMRGKLPKGRVAGWLGDDKRNPIGRREYAMHVFLFPQQRPQP